MRKLCTLLQKTLGEKSYFPLKILIAEENAERWNSCTEIKKNKNRENFIK